MHCIRYIAFMALYDYLEGALVSMSDALTLTGHHLHFCSFLSFVWV